MNLEYKPHKSFSIHPMKPNTTGAIYTFDFARRGVGGGGEIESSGVKSFCGRQIWGVWGNNEWRRGDGGGGERWKDKKNFPSTALARSVITWTKQTKQLRPTSNNNNEIMRKWKRRITNEKCLNEWFRRVILITLLGERQRLKEVSVS